MASTTSRQRGWLVTLGVLGVVDLAVTIHATVTYSPKPGQPSIMTAGQMLGWVTSGVLLTAFVLTAIGVWRSVHGIRPAPPRRPPNARPTGFRER